MSRILASTLVVVLVAATAAADVRALKAGDVPTYVELDKGERITFQLHDGTVHAIGLVDYTRTSAELTINGVKQAVRYRPQDLPREIVGMRVGVEITQAWNDRMRFKWFALTKACRLFLSDASRPVMSNPEGVYPLSPPARIAGGTIWGGGWLANRREAMKDCHIGFDVYGPLGTRLLAIEDVVVTAVWVDKDYDRMIVVDLAGKRFHYRCLHLMKALVTKGQKLKRGDVVGLIGQSGYAIYPHLHLHMMLPGPAAAETKDTGRDREYFRLRSPGVNVNPGPYIHDMYKRIDPKTFVDSHTVRLSAVDAEGNPVKWPHWRVKAPDGTLYDIGIRSKTSVRRGVNPFTFIAERRKFSLRGETTATVTKNRQPVTVIMQKTPAR